MQRKIAGLGLIKKLITFVFPGFDLYEGDIFILAVFWIYDHS